MKAIENGWVREVLIRSIQSDLFSRQGTHEHKLTNFQARMPAPKSDLAQAMIQDPRYSGMGTLGYSWRNTLLKMFLEM